MAPRNNLTNNPLNDDIPPLEDVYKQIDKSIERDRREWLGATPRRTFSFSNINWDVIIPILWVTAALLIVAAVVAILPPCGK